MAATKTSDETLQATIAGAHMRGANATPLDRKFPGYAFWGEKGSAVASADPLVLGDDGDFFHITGTVTITDIDFTTAKDGRHAWLEFDGALTLTHNATTLNLPGGANIVTAAGDRALVVQDSSDNVNVLAYVRADGRPLIPNVVRPAQATTSGSAKEFTSIPPWATRLDLTWSGLSSNDTSPIRIQLGDAGGYETANYDGAIAYTSGSPANFSSGFQIAVTAAAHIYNGSITLVLTDPTTNTWTATIMNGMSDSANVQWGAGSKSLSAVLDRIQIITAGAFDLGKVGLRIS